MHISESFTIEDIHNIRYENYEKTKNLTPAELIQKTNESANRVIQKINELKSKNTKSKNVH